MLYRIAGLFALTWLLVGCAPAPKPAPDIAGKWVSSGAEPEIRFEFKEDGACIREAAFAQAVFRTEATYEVKAATIRLTNLREGSLDSLQPVTGTLRIPYRLSGETLTLYPGSDKETVLKRLQNEEPP